MEEVGKLCMVADRFASESNSGEGLEDGGLEGSPFVNQSPIH